MEELKSPLVASVVAEPRSPGSDSEAGFGLEFGSRPLHGNLCNAKDNDNASAAGSSETETGGRTTTLNIEQRLLCNVLTLSLAFFLLFAAYCTVQAFDCTLLDNKNNLGFESLAVVYATYFFFMLVTGPIVECIGAVRVMVIASSL